MHYAAVDGRFKRVAGFAALFASLTPLSRLDGSQAEANAYSHGTTTCLQGNEGPGIRLVLAQTDRCGSNPYPRVEIDIRELPIAVRKNIVIGPNNWAFRCMNAKEACEQVPSGNIVFDHLQGSSRAGLKTEGRYELRLRSGAVESGNFRVDCLGPVCVGQHVVPHRDQMSNRAAVRYKWHKL